MPDRRPHPIRPGFDAGTVIEAARVSLGLSRLDLWVAYVAMGGGQAPDAIRAVLCDGSPLSSFDHDMLAQALNERFEEHGVPGPVPYSESFRPAPAGPRRWSPSDPTSVDVDLTRGLPAPRTRVDVRRPNDRSRRDRPDQPPRTPRGGLPHP